MPNASEGRHARPTAPCRDHRPTPQAATARPCLLAARRRRDGACGWSLQEDATRRGLWLETFREGDWPARLRHHARITEVARAVQNQIATVMRDGATPLVRHFLGPTVAKGDIR